MNEEMFKAFVLPILMSCKYGMTLDEADKLINDSEKEAINYD